VRPARTRFRTIPGIASSGIRLSCHEDGPRFDRAEEGIETVDQDLAGSASSSGAGISSASLEQRPLLLALEQRVEQVRERAEQVVDHRLGHPRPRAIASIETLS